MESSPLPQRYPEGVLDVRRLSRTPYDEGRRLQLELLERRIAGASGDVLVLCEHDPVITVGRGTDLSDVAGATIPIVEVERGGEATYHGPGQLVAYPIYALPPARRDLHRYLRDLEEVVIRVLAEVDIEGRRVDGLTGVWIGEKKVCSIGVAVRRWVAWHGLALNLAADLDAFAQFRPCGLDASVMTNVAAHTELPPTRLLFEVLVVKHFCEVFELALPPLPPPPAPDPRALPLFPQ
jgi:lipoyl(octanoyl) transferase